MAEAQSRWQQTMVGDWQVRCHNLPDAPVVRFGSRAGQPSRGWDFTVADHFVTTGAWQFVPLDVEPDSDMTSGVDEWDAMTDQERAEWMLGG